MFWCTAMPSRTRHAGHLRVFRSSPSGLVVALFLLCAIAAARVLAVNRRTTYLARQLSGARSESAAHDSAEAVLGLSLPDMMLPAVDSGIIPLRHTVGDGAALVWFFSSSDCLYCLAEASQWAEFAASHPTVAILAIASGQDLGMLKKFALSEHLPFRVAYDSDRSVRRALGLPGVGPTRILLQQGGVVVVRSGIHSQGMPFLEQAALLLRSESR